MSSIPSFAELGAPLPIVDALAERGITEPFPIQAAALADALDGRDILGRAPTGSGKTLAFGIPVIARMKPGSHRRPTALILSPTRELADQIADELRPLAESLGHRVAALYGGVGYRPQQKALDKGASLIVACPGRLEDLLQMRALTLEDVGTVVVDEADRMADMGFLPAVRRIVGATRADRHTQLFSATLDKPVAKLTKDFQRDPVRHEVGSAEPDMALAHHMFWTVERTDRVPHVAQFLDAAGSTIVFTRTRHGADRLARQLGKHGVEAAPIHGGRSQAQRTRALRAFAERRVTALVATDVAARGIHVDDVAGVVHFDPPEDASTYLHRSGRTARAGASGVVLSLVEPSGRKDTTKMQKDLGLPTGIGQPDIALVRDLHPERTAQKRTTSTDASAGDSARSGDAAKATRPADPGRSTTEDHRTDKDGGASKRDAARDGGQRTRQTGRSKERPQRDGARRDQDRSGRKGHERASGAGTDRPGHRKDRAGSGTDSTDGAELTGRVTNYSRSKGFGFIKVKGRDDVFVHISGVDGEAAEVLTKGNQVAFRLEDGRKGPVAVNVRSLSGASH